jgi:hypothetical protein
MRETTQREAIAMGLLWTIVAWVLVMMTAGVLLVSSAAAADDARRETVLTRTGRYQALPTYRPGSAVGDARH